MRKTNIHSKFRFNSINNLNYKETSLEFIAGEQKKMDSIFNSSTVKPLRFTVSVDQD
jgi:hypothetical protein